MRQEERVSTREAQIGPRLRDWYVVESFIAERDRRLAELGSTRGARAARRATEAVQLSQDAIMINRNDKVDS